MRPQTVTDEEIITIARRIFVEKGLQVSVQTIADELGVSQPALFKRFGSKKNLIIAAMQPPKVIPWFAHANAGPDERPFEEQLRELLMEIISFFKDIQPLMKLLEQSNIAPVEMIKGLEEPPPLIALRTLTAWLERCHEKELIRKTNFRVAALSIMGSMHLDNLVLPLFSSPEYPFPLLKEKENLDIVVQIFCEGLKI